jgi:hypothetical protein
MKYLVLNQNLKERHGKMSVKELHMHGIPFKAISKYGKTLLCKPITNQVMVSIKNGSKPWSKASQTQEFSFDFMGCTVRQLKT